MKKLQREVSEVDNERARGGNRVTRIFSAAPPGRGRKCGGESDRSVFVLNFCFLPVHSFTRLHITNTHIYTYTNSLIFLGGGLGLLANHYAILGRVSLSVVRLFPHSASTIRLSTPILKQISCVFVCGTTATVHPLTHTHIHSFILSSILGGKAPLFCTHTF